MSSYVCEQCANPITPTEKAIHNFKNIDARLLCDECIRVKKEIEDEL